ncbi:MAG: exodeoxyribonuclease VII large subunit [Nanoarchaeota archaeon]
MKDRTLIKISLAWAVAGIFILILTASLLAPLPIKLSELEQNVGKTVLIQGEITKISITTATTFIDLQENETTASVVLFGRPAKPLQEGDIVAAKGKVSEYKDTMELVASEVYCVKC